MASAKACNLRADKATRQSFCGHEIAEVFVNGEIYLLPFFKCRVFNSNQIYFHRQATSSDIFGEWITFCRHTCPGLSMPALPICLALM